MRNPFKREAPWVSVEITGVRGASGVEVDRTFIHGDPEAAMAALGVVVRMVAGGPREAEIRIERLEVAPGPLADPGPDCPDCGCPWVDHEGGRCRGDFGHCDCKRIQVRP